MVSSTTERWDGQLGAHQELPKGDIIVNKNEASKKIERLAVYAKIAEYAKWTGLVIGITAVVVPILFFASPSFPMLAVLLGTIYLIFAIASAEEGGGVGTFLAMFGIPLAMSYTESPIYAPHLCVTYPKVIAHFVYAPHIVCMVGAAAGAVGALGGIIFLASWVAQRKIEEQIARESKPATPLPAV